MENFSETVGAVEVPDPQGGSVRLGEQWRDRPVVLALIRHFG